MPNISPGTDKSQRAYSLHESTENNPVITKKSFNNTRGNKEHLNRITQYISRSARHTSQINPSNLHTSEAINYEHSGGPSRRISIANKSTAAKGSNIRSSKKLRPQRELSDHQRYLHGSKGSKIRLHHPCTVTDKISVYPNAQTDKHKIKNNIDKINSNKESPRRGTWPTQVSSSQNNHSLINHTTINFLQANLQNSRTATPLAFLKSQEYLSEILLLQEPHVTDNKLTGAPLSFFTAFSNNKKAAISITNLNLQPIIHHRGNYHISVNIKTTIGLINVTCIYISPSTNIQEALAELPSSRDTYAFSIIAGDYNAKSPFWGCPEEDGRGSVVSQFAAANWLIPLNVTDEGPTCVTYRGNGWPDITLSSYSLVPFIKNWRIQATETASDHRHITFSIAAKETTTSPIHRFKSQYGNYMKFANFLEKRIALSPNTNGCHQLY